MAIRFEPQEMLQTVRGDHHAPFGAPNDAPAPGGTLISLDDSRWNDDRGAVPTSTVRAILYYKIKLKLVRGTDCRRWDRPVEKVDRLGFHRAGGCVFSVVASLAGSSDFVNGHNGTFASWKLGSRRE